VVQPYNGIITAVIMTNVKGVNMDILKEAIKAASRRPFILILPLIVMFFVSAFNVYFPVLSLLGGIGSIAEGGALDEIVYLMQYLLDPQILPVLLLIIIMLCLLVSLMAGLILPGYFAIVDGAVLNRKKQPGEFINGIREHFLSFFLITLRAAVFMGLFSIFLLIACIPVIVVAKLAGDNGAGMLLPLAFLVLITLMVLFFSIMFARAYIFYWYPSALKKFRKPFAIGKRLADSHFWSIAAKLLVFDFIFVLYIYITMSTENLFLRFFAGWLIGAVYLLVFVIFIFKSYNNYLAEEIQKSKTEIQKSKTKFKKSKPEIQKTK